MNRLIGLLLVMAIPYIVFLGLQFSNGLALKVYDSVVDDISLPSIVWVPYDKNWYLASLYFALVYLSVWLISFIMAYFGRLLRNMSDRY
ncbi:MAG: hypothetical protein QM500_12245 [Methylococcales bacterium]